jgi:hypothetical protein
MWKNRVILFFLVGIAWASTGAQAPFDQSVQAFLDDMDAGRWDSVSARLNVELPRVQLVEQLKQQWLKVQTITGGASHEIPSIHTRTYLGLPHYVATRQQTRGLIRLLIAFDAQGHVTSASVGATSGASNALLVAASQRFIDDFVHRRFEETSAEYAPELKSFVTPDALARTMDQLHSAMGDFRRFLSETAVNNTSWDTVDVRCEFQKADLVIRVFLGPEQRITGFSYLGSE